ncbi:gamma carbonic anhydrase family protein [Anatilimnocola floriformis]|uniref:gamma carbonic anhydrase family protein n=1 Tax=Anatilimnocola floriformis TaxID=2948575 RepID=UPI0028F424DE|nr:gamma carbonic anhydrase family protein [Anatilimnocola floriformis]
MTIDPQQTRHRPELVHESAFIATGAVVIGNVTLAAETSVWFNAVIRGDSEAITIGAGTNVQDGCILHADPGKPCVLGERVTLGHGAIVHGAILEDDVMIGMRAVVMNGARIGRGSIVGVGAVVLEGMEVPPGSIVLGNPGKVVRPVSERHTAQIRHAAEHYVAAAKVYRQSD